MTIGADRLAKWRADPVAFSRDLELRRPDNSIGPPEWSPRQREWLGALGAGHKVVVVVAPKRSGKTLVGAVALLWSSLAEDRTSLCLANSRESAESLSFNVAKKLLERGPLCGIAKVQRGRIEFPWGTEIRAVPCSAPAVGGITVSGLLLSDELWQADDPEAFRLLSSQTEGKGAQTLVVSQASGLDSDVYRLATEGAPGVWADYVEPSEIRAGLVLNPYLTAEYLAQRRAQLPDAVFDHYHNNAWGTTENALLDADDLAACVSDTLTLPRDKWGWMETARAIGPVSVGVGIDRAQPFSGRDQTAIVAVAGYDDPPRYRVVSCDVLATGAEAEVVAVVERLRQTFGYVRIIAEVYAMADLAPRLGATLGTPTAQWQFSAFTRLAELVKSGRLEVPAEAEILVEQLGRFGVDTSRPTVRFGGGSGAAVDDSVYGLAWGLEAVGVGRATAGRMELGASRRPRSFESRMFDSPRAGASVARPGRR